MDKMKTAFYYHRYSTEMQRDSYTLKAQIRITKEIAEKYGTKIIQVYEDEASPYKQLQIIYINLL